MVDTKTETIDITLIQTKPEIYPREKIDEEIVQAYARSIEAGEKFPPIVVQKDTYVTVDGLHRDKALEMLGKKQVEVEILDIPDSELRSEAVRRNIKHGKRLTTKELRKNIIDLRFTDGKSLKEIAEIVARTEGRISQICHEYEMSPRDFGDFNSKDRKKIDLRAKVDAKKKEEIMEDLEEGLKGREIATKFGLSEPTISQIKKEHEEWLSSPIYIEMDVDLATEMFEVAFAQKLLKKARLEFKEHGVLIRNAEKSLIVIALFKDTFFWRYKVDHPFEGYAESEILTQLPMRKCLDSERIKLALIDEKTWKLRYDGYEKSHEYKNLDWREFPLPNVELDEDGIPITVHVKAQLLTNTFPRKETGQLTLRMKDGELTCSFRCHNQWDVNQKLKLEFLEKQSDAMAYVDLAMLNELLKTFNDRPVWIGMWSDQTSLALGNGLSDRRICFKLG